MLRHTINIHASMHPHTSTSQPSATVRTRAETLIRTCPCATYIWLLHPPTSTDPKMVLTLRNLHWWCFCMVTCPFTGMHKHIWAHMATCTEWWWWWFVVVVVVCAYVSACVWSNVCGCERLGVGVDIYICNVYREVYSWCIQPKCHIYRGASAEVWAPTLFSPILQYFLCIVFTVKEQLRNRP